MEFTKENLLQLIFSTILVILILYTFYKLVLHLRIVKHGKIYLAKRVGFYNRFSRYSSSFYTSPIYEFEEDGYIIRAYVLDFFTTYNKPSKASRFPENISRIYYYDKIEGKCCIVDNSSSYPYIGLIVLFCVLLLLVFLIPIIGKHGI